MKHRVRVDHLPSGKTFVGDPAEFTDKEMKNVIDMLEMAASDKLDYFSFSRKSDQLPKIVLSKKVMTECVFMLEEIG